MTLLARLGAAPDAKLRLESWRYTSLRALDAQAPQLQASRLLAAEALSELELAFGAPTAPMAANPAKSTMNPERSVFSDLAAQSPLFCQILTGGHYFVLAPGIERGLVQQQHELQVPEGVAATLLWHHTGAAANSFSNLLTRIYLAKNASLNVIRLQSAHTTAALIERTEITLAEHARLKVLDFNIGGKLARHELQIRMEGVAARSEVALLSVLDEQQLIDTQLEIQHLQANCSSQTRVKAVASGRARSVLVGRIYVAPGADGTDAQLQTNNLLLSESAEIDAKPELEIHAEEVSCSHGATVGQLDERALFYLSTRGIPREVAKQILTQAFCQSLIDQLDSPELAEQLSALLVNKLPKFSTP